MLKVLSEEQRRHKNEHAREYRRANIEKVLIRERKAAQRYFKKHRRMISLRVVRRLGISIEEYLQLDAKQNHLCALCMKPQELVKTRGGISMSRLSIDHDHTCHGEAQGCRNCIRGLLCRSCNRYLVWLEKYPHLQSEFVKEYLRQRPFSTSLITLLTVAPEGTA